MAKNFTYFIILFALIFLLLGLTFNGNIVVAQGNKARSLEIKYPKIGDLKPENVSVGLPEYIKYVFNLSLWIGAAVLVGILIYGGIQYLFSAGRVPVLVEARRRILLAFFGILLLFVGYVILQEINPQLLMFKLPSLEELAICKQNADCPAGYECKKGKCEKGQECQKDKDCAGFPDYICDKNTHTCVYQGRTLILHEVPLGQMISKHMFAEEDLQALQSPLVRLRDFLTTTTVVAAYNEQFTRLSDLNNYLKYLSEECSCQGSPAPDGGEGKGSTVVAICTLPEQGCLPGACSGDPCAKNRQAIDEIREINKKKIENILELVKKIRDKRADLEKDNDTFTHAWEDALTCLTEGNQLLTYNEYLDLVEQYEKTGWKVEVIRTYKASNSTQPIVAANDPLTFYCVRGGSAQEISTFVYGPEISAEELSAQLPSEITEGAPLNCPVEIPVGNLIDEITSQSMAMLNKQDSLADWLTQLASKIGEMNLLISQCVDQNCEANCVCEYNSCFGDCAPQPNPCAPSCLTMCLDCAGTCKGKFDGKPCPSEQIASTTAEIKKIEDIIFGFLGEADQIVPTAANFTTSTPENTGLESGVFLRDIRDALSLCRGRLTEEGELEGWALLDCPTAVSLSVIGPDNGIVTDCHSQNFFCCGSAGANFEQLGVNKFAPSLRQRQNLLIGQVSEVDWTKAQSKNFQEVPCLKQSDERWGAQTYGTEPSCTTYRQGGCGPTSLAMILSYFDSKEYSVPMIGQEIVNAGGRVCPSGTYAPSLLTVAQNFHSHSGYFLPNVPFEQWKEEVKKCFDEGGLMIGYVEYPYIESSGGHFIALVGLYDDNNVIVHDTVYTRRGAAVPCPNVVPLEVIYNARRFGNQSGICIKK